MEHRLITGGEQFLPFARSCVTKLKKLGLPYANQSYEVDGVSIKVRIEPGHEYIRLEGGSGEMPMDSGIVDLLALGPLAAGTYLPGVMYESGAVQNYTAAYSCTKDPGYGGVYGWKTSPGNAPSMQFAGTVMTPSQGVLYRGRVLPAGGDAAAFSPEVVSLGPQTYREEDPSLLAKKLVASLCPASIFTGKCRMYVQAMYGSPLYSYAPAGRDKLGEAMLAPPIELVTGMSAAPAIKVVAYVSKKDFTLVDGVKKFAEYPPVMIDTSCGVMLDPTDGKHWLVVIASNGDVVVYPLIAPQVYEAQRKRLAGGHVGGVPLPADEIEKLEAYVLSGCLPDVKNKQVIGSVGGIGKYSVGYGWHWNWAGTDADIVVSHPVEQDMDHSCMSSTHHRITVALVDKRWSFYITPVEGPVLWAVHRGLWTILEPDFSTYTLSKVTPKHTKLIPCSAPIYAFYDRHTLKVLRVDVKETLATPQIRTMSEGFSIYGYGGSWDRGNTLGTRDGFLEDMTSSPTYYEATFSCGAVTTRPLFYGKSEQGAKVTVSGKADVGTSRPFGMNSFDGALDNGYPDAPVNGVYARTPFSGYVVQAFHLFTYNFTQASFLRGWGSSAAIVIPFMDSQALYIHSDTRTTDSEGGTTEKWQSAYANYHITYELYTNVDGVIGRVGDVERYGWNNSAGAVNGHADLVSEEPHTKLVEVNTPDLQHLISTAGVAPAVFTHLSQIHNDEVDFIYATFPTLTGVNQKSPLLIANGYSADKGTNNTNASLPAIVGWA